MTFHAKEEQYKKRAAELVAKMTLEEKILQTMHKAPAIERLGIPAYNWWNEALHGVARAGTATVFPQAIGLAATFDEELLEKIGTVISDEARAKYQAQSAAGDRDIYKGLTFWSPNVNIFRDPRWGRGHETYGEDPYLTSRLALRFIEGLQGNDEDYLKVAACAKHFAVHSGPEGLRHSFNAEVSKRDLYETYLPAFEVSVKEAGVEAIMGAYNRTNGEPCCGSKELLQDILRRDWGFNGHVTSDCWALQDFYMHHKVCDGPEESVAKAMNAGCDLNCGGLNAYLNKAVADGLIDEAAIDEAVIHLFTTRMKLGLFDDCKDHPYCNIDYSVVDSKEHAALNLTAARESVVLLKNNGLLPLDLSKIKTIGVVGPNANSRRALVGNYEGTASRYVTVLEGIQDYVGDQARVLYSEGCHLFMDRMSSLAEADDRISEVKAICELSDVVVVCLGLDAGLEGEEGDTGNEFASGDKLDLNFPGLQNRLLEVACESKKPVILIIQAGSAMACTYAESNAAAILDAWYPGALGGMAVAETLFGANNPSGRLPVTFYRTSEELPDFTDYTMQGRTYRYMKQDALYPFGFGLSYTSFDYENIRFEKEAPAIAKMNVSDEEEIGVLVDVTNTGERAGIETAQLYIRYEGDFADAPNYSLKGINKVLLQPGESQTIRFALRAKDFALCNEDGIKTLFNGTYKIFVGGSQPDERSAHLTGQRLAFISPV